MVDFEHNVRHFKPSGACLKDLEEVNITIDELESLRLSYIEKMKQDDAARKMQIHQSTFQRTVHKTLEKISDALVSGKAIRVEGGDYVMPGKDGTGPTGQGPVGGAGMGGRGRGGRGGGAGGQFASPAGAGSAGVCKCPSCGHEQPHQAGTPCSRIKCTECGSMMIRK